VSIKLSVIVSIVIFKLTLTTELIIKAAIISITDFFINVTESKLFRCLSS